MLVRLPSLRRAAPAAASMCAFGLLLTTAAGAAVDFERDLKPVLESKCLSCHNPNNLKGDLSLATIAEIEAFGDDLIIPGDHRRSLLYTMTIPEAEGDKPEMPKKGDPLSETEAALLAEWIDGGAGWPEGLVLKEASKADKTWWAFQPLRESASEGGRSKMESRARGVAENPIDIFIEQRLAEDGLEMNPPADPRTLIRRMYYDLLGLPPSPEDVAAFAAAYNPISDLPSSISALEKLIDRLLASPHYGERWGRHWLDVVRFGESNGYERNFIIDNLWPFRDYVIESINEDKPFDRFIREHLAGDVLGKGDPAVEVGSAFLVAGPYDDVKNQDPAQTAQIRANTMDEIISATGEAFLGMTLGCARCHDHKFDPILQRDYYGLYATFSGVRHGSAPLATPEEKAARAAKLKPLDDRRAALEEEQQALAAAILKRARDRLAEHEARWTRAATDRTGTEERFEPLTAKFVRLVCEAQDINPDLATGFGIDEFEIWSAGAESRNVALASNGGKARGKAREIEDFPNAYGPQHAIDGKTGARFIATGTDLTIELAQPARINRVLFSSARGESTPEHPKFAFVAEYRIEVSGDGETWREIAHGRDRKPVSRMRGMKPGQVSPGHLDHRLLGLEMTDNEKAARDRLRLELAAVNRAIAGVPELPSVWIGTRNVEDAAGPFHVFAGGSPQKRGEQVVPASLSTLSEVAPAYRLSAGGDESQRRLELANWITHPDNPLAARVLANRLWQYHFGIGIVDTPNDFGYMGGRPTHPELLDFLAVELKKSGWRLKAMHRLIMTSRAYRQASAWRAEGARVDGDSRLLWRFPPRRLSAEEIRDTALAVSGALDETMGGPGFRLYRFMQDNVCTYAPLDEHDPETYRRAVYHQNARASVVDLMTEFDQPDCAFSAPKRAETTTPLQALTMMNHGFAIDMAEALAERIEARGARDPESQVIEAFQIAFQRASDPVETTRSVALARTHGLRALCRAILNSSELIYLD